MILLFADVWLTVHWNLLRELITAGRAHNIVGAFFVPAPVALEASRALDFMEYIFVCPRFYL